MTPNEMMERAMGSRTNPRQPIFRDHNCWKCRDGELPCTGRSDGDYGRCEFAFRLNDGDVSRHTMQRLASLFSAAIGRRLTYKELIA